METAPNTPEQEPEEQSTAVVVIDQNKVNATVSKEYSVTDQRIAELKEMYGGLQIADGKDTENIALAKQAVKELRTIRTTVDKKRLELKRMFTGAIDGIAKKIGLELNPIEERLKKRLDDIEREEAIAAAAALKSKIMSLTAAGYQYNGVAYVCGTNTIFEVSLPEMSDADMDAAVEYGIVFREQEAEAERVRKAETERLQSENAAKEKELADLRAKLAAMEAANEPKPEPEPDPLAETIQTIEETLDGMDQDVFEAAATFASKQMAETIRDDMGTLPGPGQVQVTWPESGETELRGTINTSMPIRENKTSLSPAFAIPVEADKFPSMERSAADVHEVGFDAGYECFRKQAMALFSKPEPKLTRPQWVEFFQNIKPTDRV